MSEDDIIVVVISGMDVKSQNFRATRVCGDWSSCLTMRSERMILSHSWNLISEMIWEQIPIHRIVRRTGTESSSPSAEAHENLMARDSRSWTAA